MQGVWLAVVPVFGTVALGFWLARRGIVTGAMGEGLVRFMFYLAIPAMLFVTLATAELPPSIPWDYLAAYYVPTLMVFALGAAVAARQFQWQAHEVGIAGMVASYSNLVLLGFPLTIAALGERATLPMFVLLATHSMVMFPLVTLVLERGASPVRNSDRRRRFAYLQRAAATMLNPVVLSLVAGITANRAGLTIPETPARVLALVGDAGPACALLALGVGLGAQPPAGALGKAGVLVALKNLVHPAAVWIACLALDVAPEWRTVAVILAAMPCGINAFIFAAQYRVQEAVVANCVVASTVASGVVVTALLLAIGV